MGRLLHCCITDFAVLENTLFITIPTEVNLKVCWGEISHLQVGQMGIFHGDLLVYRRVSDKAFSLSQGLPGFEWFI